MPKIIIKKKQETITEITPRDKAIAEYHTKQREKLRFENREPDYHELQEQLAKMKQKAQRWKDRFHGARNDYGKNCSFEEEVQIFGLGCKICGEWCYGDIDYVDEFRATGKREPNWDRIPVCSECCDKCKCWDCDCGECGNCGDDDTDCDSSVSSTDSLEKYKGKKCFECSRDIPDDDVEKEKFYIDFPQGKEALWCIRCAIDLEFIPSEDEEEED